MLLGVGWGGGIGGIECMVLLVYADFFKAPQHVVRKENRNHDFFMV